MTDLLPTVDPTIHVNHHAADVTTTIVHAATATGGSMSSTFATIGDYMFISVIAGVVGLALGAGATWYFKGGSSTVSALQADVTALKAKVGL